MKRNQGKRAARAQAAALLALLALGACGPRPDEAGLVGRWDVAGVEHEGRFVPVGDHVALSKIPGTRNLSRQGFALTRSGDYLAGGGRAKWKLLDKETFQVEYPLHGEAVKLDVNFRKRGGQLLIRKPGGELWIVLAPEAAP